MLIVEVRGYIVECEPLTVRDVLKTEGEALELLPIAVRKVISAKDPEGLYIGARDLPAGIMQQVMKVMQA